MNMFLIFWLSSWTLFAVPVPGSQSMHVTKEIESVLQAQVNAWNGGKLEKFMETYWNSPELTFFSGGNSLSGWQATLERYRNRYQQEGQDMGHLNFSDLKIVELSSDSGFVRGRFHLQRKGMEDATGLFTLILRRLPEGWKIIHDHTSAGD
jgi:beta-aspartyl-peptidase (threonine type)